MYPDHPFEGFLNGTPVADSFATDMLLILTMIHEREIDTQQGVSFMGGNETLEWNKLAKDPV